MLPEFPANVRLVGSFEELLNTRFEGPINALCWPRELEGDYAEVLRHLPDLPGINAVDADRLLDLPLSAEGKIAARQLLADQQLLSSHGMFPELNCIRGYLREEELGPVRTDVYDWHADSATVEADTWLCTYLGAGSEVLPNAHAVQRTLVPQTRAELLAFFGGPEGPEFEDFLSQSCYDLHYAPLPHAAPFALSRGHLWRMALVHPQSSVAPCIHRAPDSPPGSAPRLLLIS